MSQQPASGRVAELRRGAEATRSLADQVVLALQDHILLRPFQGDLYSKYQQALDLYEKACYRIDHAAGENDIVRANRTAAKALLALKAVMREAGLKVDVASFRATPEDTCFYCARYDRPPYRELQLGDIPVQVCSVCQKRVPQYTRISDDSYIPTRSLSRMWLPIVLGALILAIAVSVIWKSVMNSASPAPAATVTPQQTSTPQPAVALHPTATALPPTAIPATAPPNPNTPVFQAFWQNGGLGWDAVYSPSNGGGKWQAIGNILTFNGHEAGIFQSPYAMKAGANFAVEAEIQSLGPPPNNPGDECDQAFGVLVRSDAPTDDIFYHLPGFIGGYYYQKPCYLSGQEGPELGLFTPFVNENFVGNKSSFDPGSGWHKYRVEVRGNQYRVLVDGQQAVQGTTNDSLSGTKVGLAAFRDQIDVRYLKVFVLR